MADEPEETEAELIARWRDKTDFAPGLADDTVIPQTRYQVLNGIVYSRTSWMDGSVARGIMTLDELEKQIGKPIVKEGWYDPTGKYYGLYDPELEDSA
jgi:hypothetical protein